MTKQPVADNNHASDHLQIWILRVYIHCEGCKKKVYKVLQSIDGVYKTEVDSLQQKAVVTGSVDGDTLVQKLLKSGKHAEILPESFKPTAVTENASGNSKKKKKKKQNNKEKNDETTGNNNEHVDEEKEESEAATTEGNEGGNDQQVAPPAVDDNGGGGKKKKKKKKGDKKDDNAPLDGDAKADNEPASMEELNLSRPGHQTVYATPYDLPAVQSYYPTPAYGVSYSTSYPSTESSYYTPPVYGYAQSHPSTYYPPRPHPSYYPRSAFDDHDDENGNGRSCTIM